MFKGFLFVYNCDLQEDKELVFDLVQIFEVVFFVFVGMIVMFCFYMECMVEFVFQGFLFVIDVVEWLVKWWVLFCDVYEIFGVLVCVCEEQGIGLEDVFDELLLFVFLYFVLEVCEVFMIEGLVVFCMGVGGIVLVCVVEQCVEFVVCVQVVVYVLGF